MCLFARFIWKTLFGILVTKEGEGQFSSFLYLTGEDSPVVVNFIVYKFMYRV